MRLARIFHQKRISLAFAVLTVAFLFSRSQTSASDAQSPAVTPSTHDAIQDALRATTYDLPFGNSPYLPSQATTEFSGLLKPTDIPSAAYCGHCHAGVHAQWRQSGHANSFRAPWYVKNVQELANTKGVAYTRHCEGCHNPAALLTGALTTGSAVPRPHDEDGVTCMVCHSIRSVSSTSGVGSYVMGQPAVMVDVAGKPVAGLPSDAEILAHLDWHKQAVMRPLYKTSEYCAACHKASLPKSLNDYKWLRTFTTYDEWQQSSWSTETPLPFYRKEQASTCQTCHMPQLQADDVSAHNGNVASHRWLGANSAVPAQYGFDEQARRIVEYLRADKLQIDIFALTVEHQVNRGHQVFIPSELIAPLGARTGVRPITVLPGDWVRVDVVVRNKGIGHNLVPELRDFYESWLEFEARDDAGNVVYHSGGVDAQHRVDPNARNYTLQILTREGKSIDHHEVWKTYTRAYDASIASGRSDVVRFRFRVPDHTQGLTLAAALRYRRFRRVFTDWVFDDKATDPDRFPTITLADGSYHLALGRDVTQQPATLPSDLTDLLRWNNYGIGMIDRQQFDEAFNAFSHVVAVDPKYEPGYVNVAIAEYMRGRYPAALHWIDLASKMKSDDSRALYYKGLCLRWQQRYEDAIAALQPVAEAYPRFRQVHQELGYIYMLRRRYPESKAEYEKVLAIDPDDPTTHRWLGPVLEALGDHKGSLREAALAAQTTDDAAAGFVIQQFWRDHTATASKSMPGHVYSDNNDADDFNVLRMLNLRNPPSYIWVDHYEAPSSQQ
jgi:tetratricopeptide (TPR) repeat protein